MVIAAWTIAGALALLGLTLLLRPLIFRRPAPWACAACGYDLRGAPSAACPECGRQAASARRSRTLRSGLALLLALPLVLPLAGLLFMKLAPRRAAVVVQSLLPRGKVLHDVRRGNAHILVTTPWDPPPAVERFFSAFRVPIVAFEERVRVKVRGRLILDETDFRIEPFIQEPPGLDGTADLDGDQEPDLIIETFSGGAHCCWTYFVLSLGKHPRVIGTIEAAHGARFERVMLPDGRASTIIDTNDDIWDYWNASYVGSAHAGVALRLANGEITIDPERQRSPLPSRQELDADIQRLQQLAREHRGPGPFAPTDALEGGTDFWQIPIALMYSGHEAEAWAFLDAAWPDDVPGKAQFKAQFREQLEKSAYLPRIREAFKAIGPDRSGR